MTESQDVLAENVTRDNAASFGTFSEHRKTATTRISDFTMPPGTTYQTPEGLRAEDEDTRIAFDVQGGVYPIRESVFQASYAPAALVRTPETLDVERPTTERAAIAADRTWASGYSAGRAAALRAASPSPTPPEGLRLSHGTLRVAAQTTLDFLTMNGLEWQEEYGSPVKPGTKGQVIESLRAALAASPAPDPGAADWRHLLGWLDLPDGATLGEAEAAALELGRHQGQAPCRDEEHVLRPDPP